MDLSRAPTVAPSLTPPAPTQASPGVGAVGVGSSNQALLASLGLGPTSPPPPVATLAALLPTLGPVATVVLDALPVSTAQALANANADQDWASEWLREANLQNEGLAAGPVAAGVMLGASAGGLLGPDPLPGAPATFAEAMARHAADEAAVEALFASARSVTPGAPGADSRATRLRNSVEWIDAGEIECLVYSHTHDGHLRPTPPGQFTWFHGSYDPSLDPSGHPVASGDVVTTFALLGDCDGDVLRLFAPAAVSEATLADTLVHEVQHDADQHGGLWSQGEGDDTDAAHRAPAWAFEGYRTEFNAWSSENPQGSSMDPFAVEGAVVNRDIVATVDGQLDFATTDFASARQAAIFSTFVDPGIINGEWGDPSTWEWTTPYGYIPYYFVADPAFRKLVNETDVVRSGNPINSVRIQALSEAIEAHDDAAIEAGLAALDAADREVLGVRATSIDFWSAVDDRIGVPAAQALRARVRGGPLSVDGLPTCEATETEAPATVVVTAGDTLEGLSGRYLGGPERVAELAELNGLELGTAAEVLQPGQRLRLPAG